MNNPSKHNNKYSITLKNLGAQGKLHKTSHNVLVSVLFFSFFIFRSIAFCLEFLKLCARAWVCSSFNWI